ncbi:MAG: thioredoxin family protein [Candidatus Gastranaerophilales bacterium]|nr:thioredoxin family protein [Candidatus Gastranaerophilales bacterium]
MIKELHETNFDGFIASGITLVEFFATWCGYCQKQQTVIEELANDNITVGQVDVDKNLALVRQYNIVSFPSFIIFKDGEAVKKFSGLHSKNAIMQFLSHYLK